MTDAERIAELEEHVLLLRRQMGLDIDADELGRVARGLGVRPAVATVLLSLYHAKTWCSRERLLMALPENEDRQNQVILVYISHIRKALGTDAVLSKYTVGYTLGALGVSAVKRALSETA